MVPVKRRSNVPKGPVAPNPITSATTSNVPLPVAPANRPVPPFTRNVPDPRMNIRDKVEPPRPGGRWIVRRCGHQRDRVVVSSMIGGEGRSGLA